MLAFDTPAAQLPSAIDTSGGTAAVGSRGTALPGFDLVTRGSPLDKPFDYVGVTQNCVDLTIVIALSFIIFLCQ